MESFASRGGMLPEQIWDEPDRPEVGMALGRPTGSAMPLMWAHAEYIKLLRSAADGRVFDVIPIVAERYLGKRPRPRRDLWKHIRQVRQVAPGETLRIEADEPFRLHSSADGWWNTRDTDASSSELGIYFVDLAVARYQSEPLVFTFYWTKRNEWEGKDYKVDVRGGE